MNCGLSDSTMGNAMSLLSLASVAVARDLAGTGEPLAKAATVSKTVAVAGAAAQDQPASQSATPDNPAVSADAAPGSTAGFAQLLVAQSPGKYRRLRSVAGSSDPQRSAAGLHHLARSVFHRRQLLQQRALGSLRGRHPGVRPHSARRLFRPTALRLRRRAERATTEHLVSASPCHRPRPALARAPSRVGSAQPHDLGLALWRGLRRRRKWPA